MTTVPDAPAAPEDPLPKKAFWAICIAAIVLKLWLVLAFGMRAAGNAEADDRLFVVLADALLRGDWLGEYNRFTLAKGPFFSIWIAIMFLANIPIPLSYQLLHIAACGLLILALKPLLPSRPIRLVLFLLLLFDPSTCSAIGSWVVRDGIYMPQTVIILACIIALLTRLDQSPTRLAGWSVGLGVTLATYWTTREEGIWIVPGAALALLYALVCLWRKHQAALAKTALLLLPIPLCVAGVLGVCALNQRHYGVFEVVDFTSPGFTRANGALMRVNHEHWNQFANVPKEVRMKIYPVSPAFAELQDFLEGPPGLGWGRGAEIWLNAGTPSPQDIRGGFFVWALRHAVYQKGYYSSAQDADAFYARIADEINAACGDGRLACGPERASLTPPWRPGFASLLVRSYWQGLRMMATFGDVTVMNMPSAGPAEKMLIFEDLGRARITPLLGDVSEPRLRNQANLDNFRMRQMARLNSMYKIVAPYLTIAAFVAFLIACVLEIRARTLSPSLVILVMMLAWFAARLAILSIISITSFEAMKLRYFLPLYPLLLLFWLFAMHHAVQLATAFARNRSASPSQTESA